MIDLLYSRNTVEEKKTSSRAREEHMIRPSNKGGLLRFLL